jgi:hypothetical protein
MGGVGWVVEEPGSGLVPISQRFVPNIAFQQEMQALSEPKTVGNPRGQVIGQLRPDTGQPLVCGLRIDPRGP